MEVNKEYAVMNLSFYIHFFLQLFHQTSITILTTFFMNLKSWRSLLQPKRSASTFIMNSSNFG